jgi:hypothetical protein
MKSLLEILSIPSLYENGKSLFLKGRQFIRPTLSFKEEILVQMRKELKDEIAKIPVTTIIHKETVVNDSLGKATSESVVTILGATAGLVALGIAYSNTYELNASHERERLLKDEKIVLSNANKELIARIEDLEKKRFWFSSK